MNRFILIVAALAALSVPAVLAQNYNFAPFNSRYRTTASIASQIRNLTRSWVAGNNTLPPAAYYKGVLYDRLGETRLAPAILVNPEDIALPDTFDARQKWSMCPSLNVIRNQGCCGSCWAISAASAMSDRWCIKSKGKEQFSFGAADMLACCHACGDGCKGGYLGPAWQYWVNQGVSSGGPFRSRQGCHPYPIDVCDASGEEADTPKCSKKCQSGYNMTDVWQDRRYGRVAYSIPADEQKIMEEIYLNGPVQAAFMTYQDFHAYKSGVYRHVWGHMAGGHAVKLMGWGVENGMKYWLVANSWGEDWGDNGFFKIVRGENHCGIEKDVHAGLPSFNKHLEFEGIHF
ncbi:cathepsin B-like [Aedes albopictus]|uniref:Peptidase C1A papain C-terminal domain-containing protein n=1 Tax=Aedes albopictus TaxID=7160 RepID=A0ABM1ZS36_AEDAL|nr:cathepsin B-like [Aedes albopictus]